jgi:mono/diheme cytochrome c family protein
MLRGRERYGIYCAPCHGDTGIGDGPVARRAAKLAEGTWTPPSDLTAAATVARPEGELFDVISHGIRTMPAYSAQIPVADRWAIVAYLRALQRSANGRPDDVPTERRSEFR